MSEKQNEVSVLVPNEIAEVVKNGGIELSKADQIASHYAPMMIEAQQHAKKLEGLDVNNPEDVAIARRVRIDLGSLCSSTGKQKDNDKEIIKIEGSFIMALHNTVVNYAKLTQEDAKAIEQHAERLEQKRLEALRIDRVEQLNKFEANTDHIDVEYMSDEIWSNYLNGVELSFTQAKEAEAKAEQLRIDNEKKQNLFISRERELLPMSKYCKVETLTIESTVEEFEALKKIATDNQAAEEKKIETERVAQEKARLEAEKKAAQVQKELEATQAKAKKEREAAEKEAEAQRLKLKAIEDAKLKAEKLESERLAKIEADKKTASQAPDKDKIKTAVESLEFPLIDVKDSQCVDTLGEIRIKFRAFKKWANSEVDKIK